MTFTGSIRPLVLLLMLAPAAFAQQYTDDFEAGTINPFWTQIQQFGSVSLSTDQNHTPGGRQSLKFSSTQGGQRGIAVQHNFASPQQGQFSVWFYDSAAGQETQYETIQLYNSVTTDYASIGTQDFDAYCYEAQLQNYNHHTQQGPNANCGTYPQISTTNIHRTNGWHRFDIDVGAGAITLLIDGNVVFTTSGNYAYDSVALYQSGPSWRPDTISYWDDFCYGSCSGPASQALQFVPVAPCRVADTRLPNGPFGGPPIAGQTSRDFVIPNSSCGAPTSAAAYALNVTVVPNGRLGYLTIWPSGQGQPTVSLMNSPDGRIKANAAIIAAGNPNGSVSVFVTDTTNVVIDIDGYFVPATTNSLQFYPLAPCRVIDTRNANGDLGGPFLQAGTERDFPVLESACIPQGVSAAAYSLNVTVVPKPAGQRLGYLSVWPVGQDQPVVSTLNNLTGTIVANAAIVPAGTNGAIAVYPNNNTDLLIDINGYFAAQSSSGLSLYTLGPCRLIDTRTVGNGQPFQGELPLNVIGSACAPPSSAQAYVLNGTVVPPGGFGYLTLWPDGEDQPLVSTLNAIDGAITSNMAIVPTNNGSVDAYASALTQLILDLYGYFAP